MSLPKIDQPLYEITIPSTKQKVRHRPFLVKEEKILLMALQGGDQKEIFSAVEQIVNNCLQDDIDVHKLTTFDLEYIFLQLRIRSMGEVINLRFHPRKETDCEECKSVRIVPVDVSDAKVDVLVQTNPKISLSNGVGIVLRYPTFKEISFFEGSSKANINDFFQLVWSCIDYIFDGEKIYSPKDYTNEEGMNFIENLKAEEFRAIEQFFESIPKLRKIVNVKCKSCGFEEDYVLEGLDDFFE